MKNEHIIHLRVDTNTGGPLLVENYGAAPTGVHAESNHFDGGQNGNRIFDAVTNRLQLREFDGDPQAILALLRAL